MMKIKFRDVNQNLVDHMVACGLEATCGSIFDDPTPFIVSPANSFGFMDGGIDALYTDYFGQQIMDRVQERIQRNFEGELLVGQAFTISTGNGNFPFLVVAPTMRVPSSILDPIAIRLSVRAALRAADSMLASKIVFPGMGTGAGKVPFDLAARQMYAGCLDYTNPKPFPKSWREAYMNHVDPLGEMTWN